MQVARDLLPGGIGRGRVGGLADGLHRADAGVDGKAARLQAGDRAALLVHAEEERNFGIGLRIFQQCDGLCAVLQVFGEIDQSADWLRLDGGLCGLARERGRFDLGDGLWRDEEELPELFIQRHGRERLVRELRRGQRGFVFGRGRFGLVGFQRVGQVRQFAVICLFAVGAAVLSV